MPVTDPVADLLTRIRNAAKAGHKRTDIPASNLKKEIARILLEQNFISDYKVLEDDKQNILRIHLKYRDNKPVILGLKRVSKPGIRQYRKSSELPRVLNGLGIVIVSTSKGIMTDAQARKERLGGEVMAYIW